MTSKNGKHVVIVGHIGFRGRRSSCVAVHSRKDAARLLGIVGNQDNGYVFVREGHIDLDAGNVSALLILAVHGKLKRFQPVLTIQRDHLDATVKGEHTDLRCRLPLLGSQLGFRHRCILGQRLKDDLVVEIERRDDQRPKESTFVLVGEVGRNLITNAMIIDLALIDLFNLLVVPSGHVLRVFDQVHEFRSLHGQKIVLRVAHPPLHGWQSAGHVLPPRSRFRVSHAGPWRAVGPPHRWLAGPGAGSGVSPTCARASPIRKHSTCANPVATA